MDNNSRIETGRLVEEIKIAIKDVFVATTHKYLDEIHIRFPNGQIFTVAVWEEKPK